MNRVQQLVESFTAPGPSLVSSGDDGSAEDGDLKMVKTLVLSEKPSLGQLVEYCQSSLTDKDPFVRGKALRLLSYLLEDCDTGPMFITPETTNHLTTFLLARLADQTSVLPSLRGLNAIFKLHAYDGSDFGLTILLKIFAELNIHNFSQPSRLAAFTLMSLSFEAVFGNKSLLEKATKVDDQLISGVLNSVDGEKDPRCLNIAFGLVKNVCCHFKVDRYAEELFDVLFCYFPITFRTQKDSPYNVTAESLKAALNDCLAATPLFAQFALPNLIEKLESASIAAKQDTLALMKVAFPVYGADAVVGHSKWLLESLLSELEVHAVEAPPSEDDLGFSLERGVVHTLRIIAESTESESSKATLSAVLQRLLTVKSFDPCPAWVSSLLRAVVASSDQACTFIVENYINPVVISKLDASQRSAVKLELLNLLTAAIAGSSELYGSYKSAGLVDLDLVECEHPLAASSTFMQRIFVEALSSTDSELQSAGFRGLAALVSATGVLGSENSSRFTILSTVVLNKGTRPLLLGQIRDWSLYRPQWIMEGVLPVLLSVESVTQLDFELLTSLCVHLDVSCALFCLFACSPTLKSLRIIEMLSFLANCIYNHCCTVEERAPVGVVNILARASDEELCKISFLQSLVVSLVLQTLEFGSSGNFGDGVDPLTVPAQFSGLLSQTPLFNGSHLEFENEHFDGSELVLPVASLTALLLRLVPSDVPINVSDKTEAGATNEIGLAYSLIRGAKGPNAETFVDEAYPAMLFAARLNKGAGAANFVVGSDANRFANRSLLWKSCVYRGLVRAGRFDALEELYNLFKDKVEDLNFIVEFVALDYAPVLFREYFYDEKVKRYAEAHGLSVARDSGKMPPLMEHFITRASGCNVCSDFKRKLMRGVWALAERLRDSSQEFLLVSETVALLPVDIIAENSTRLLPLILAQSNVGSVKLLTMVDKLVQREPALLVKNFEPLMSWLLPLLSSANPKVRFLTLQILVSATFEVDEIKRAGHYLKLKPILKKLLDDPKRLVRRQAILCFNRW